MVDVAHFCDLGVASSRLPAAFLESALDELVALLDDLRRPGGVVRALKHHQHLPAGKRLVQLVGVVRRDERVFFPVDEANLLVLWYFPEALHDVHLVDGEAGEFVDLALDAGEDAGEEAVEEAAAGRREELGAGLFAERGEVGVGGVGDHDVALAAHQQTHCAHAPAPAHHLVSLSLQEGSRNVNILALRLPQRYELPFSPVSAAAEVEAGQSDAVRNAGEEERAFEAAGSVAVQIENNVSHGFLFVEGELKGHKEGLCREALADPAGGLEYFWVVDEPGRTDEHVGELLHDAAGRVVLHLEERRPHGDLGVVGVLLGNAGFLEGHIHSNL